MESDDEIVVRLPFKERVLFAKATCLLAFSISIFVFLFLVVIGAGLFHVFYCALMYGMAIRHGREYDALRTEYTLRCALEDWGD